MTAAAASALFAAALPAMPAVPTTRRIGHLPRAQPANLTALHFLVIFHARRCEQCLHERQPRSLQEAADPMTGPKRRSPHWNKPEKNQTKQETLKILYRAKPAVPLF